MALAASKSATQSRATKPSPCDVVRIPVLPIRDAVLFPGVVHTMLIARESSRRAIRQAQEEGTPVLAITQIDPAVENVRSQDLHTMGVIATPIQISPLPDGTLRAVLKISARASGRNWQRKRGVNLAEPVPLVDLVEDSLGIEALRRLCADSFSRLAEGHPQIPIESLRAISLEDSASHAADLIAYHLPVNLTDKQGLLAELDVKSRHRRLYELLRHEERLLDVQRNIVQQVDQAVSESQREFYLREQLRAIQSELGGDDSFAEIELWREKVDLLKAPSQVKERALQEIGRLEKMGPSAAESSTIRSYLDYLLSLPYESATTDRIDLRHAREVLDHAHFGLEPVKERILEFLAVQKLTKSLRGSVLCFSGPPGVGKTSVARSIADAMGRKFVRVALGGLRDEAELRGHRRTYVGAMPGRLIRELRHCGTRNPVFLLDEIDKLGSDHRGDPAGVLLEVLDPSQNREFSDHYIELPFDMSDVLFIVTANVVDAILPALRDRLEIVQFSSYTDRERLQIAKDYILPKSLEKHGLSSKQCQIAEEALEAIANEYTYEPGVRQLEKIVDSLCRKAALQIAEKQAKHVQVSKDTVERWLGPAPISVQRAAPISEVGRTFALAVSDLGGAILRVESALMPCHSPQPDVKVTGNVGEVMSESGLAALTFVRSNAKALGLSPNWQYDCHLHIAEGATPKDGPSAGLALVISLASAATGIPVAGTIAATGEITLQGLVMPVGGIREKMVAASRAGIKKVLVPIANHDEAVRANTKLDLGLELIGVESVLEALNLAGLSVDQKSLSKRSLR